LNQRPPKSKAGFARILVACKYSYAGFRSAHRYEAAFRQELVLAAILIPLALALETTLTAKALLISTVGLVLIVELMNSAIEAIVDRVSLDYHELAKRAKDIGSAAVMLSMINCAVVWLLVLWDIFA
jgi:diacylglycerol kinase (ATP)